ncbi:DUF3768 domain-containing protein [Leptospira interrogans]
MTPTAHKLAEQNDRFRKTLIGGRVLITPGIRELELHQQCRIMEAVTNYTDFSEANDPYSEHEFGVVEIGDVPTVFWKIDYYNADLTAGSPDPLDPNVTVRVLTIYLASEH